MACTRTATLEKAPRRMRLVVMSRKKRSTTLSQAAPVGVKCVWKRGGRRSQRFTRSCLRPAGACHHALMSARYRRCRMAVALQAHTESTSRTQLRVSMVDDVRCGVDVGQHGAPRLGRRRGCPTRASPRTRRAARAGPSREAPRPLTSANARRRPAGAGARLRATIPWPFPRLAGRRVPAGDPARPPGPRPGRAAAGATAPVCRAATSPP